MISVSEDGDVRIAEYLSLQELSDEFTQDDLPLPPTRSALDDMDLMEWGNSVLIIKGEVVQPKAAKVVTMWVE